MKTNNQDLGPCLRCQIQFSHEKHKKVEVGLKRNQNDDKRNVSRVHKTSSPTLPSQPSHYVAGNWMFQLL